MRSRKSQFVHQRNLFSDPALRREILIKTLVGIMLGAGIMVAMLWAASAARADCIPNPAVVGERAFVYYEPDALCPQGCSIAYLAPGTEVTLMGWVIGPDGQLYGYLGEDGADGYIAVGVITSMTQQLAAGVG